MRKPVYRWDMYRWKPSFINPFPPSYEVVPKIDDEAYEKGKKHMINVTGMDDRIAIFKTNKVAEKSGYRVYESLPKLLGDFEFKHSDAKKLKRIFGLEPIEIL